MPFADYVKGNILIPAGMEKPSFFEADKEDLIPNMAHGYEYEDVSNMPEERTASEIDKEAKKEWYERIMVRSTFSQPRQTAACTLQPMNSYYGKSTSQPYGSLRRNAECCTYATDKGKRQQFSSYQNRPNTWYGYGWFIGACNRVITSENLPYRR